METSFCTWTLLFVFSVWGEVKITQNPDFSVKGIGQSITLSCDTTGLNTDYIFWLRQYNGWEIEHLLCYSKNLSQSYVPPKLQSRFVPRYDTSEKKFILTIQDLRTEDSSTIFCATVYGSSNGTALQVSSSAAVNIFPIYPTLHQIQSQTTVMVGCLARSNNSDIRITWISGSGLTFPSVFNKKNASFSVTSYLSVSTTDWKSGNSYTCSVNGIQIKISMKTDILQSRPTVLLYSSRMEPSNEDAKTMPTTEIPDVINCLVSEFYPSLLNVSWYINGNLISSNFTNIGPKLDSAGKYIFNSILKIFPNDWNDGLELTCQVSHASLASPITRKIHKPKPPDVKELFSGWWVSGILGGLIVLILLIIVAYCYKKGSDHSEAPSRQVSYSKSTGNVNDRKNMPSEKLYENVCIREKM